MNSTESTTSSATGRGPAEGPSRLETFFGRDRVDVAGLSLWLDALGDDARAAAVVAMTPRQQAALFDAAKGFRPVSLDHFVPAAAGLRTQVVHTGKNSIPIFSRFEKRFYRPDAGSPRLWGYNQNPRSIQAVTGPGYFVAY